MSSRYGSMLHRLADLGAPAASDNRQVLLFPWFFTVLGLVPISWTPKAAHQIEVLHHGIIINVPSTQDLLDINPLGLVTADGAGRYPMTTGQKALDTRLAHPMATF